MDCAVQIRLWLGQERVRRAGLLLPGGGACGDSAAPLRRELAQRFRLTLTARSPSFGAHRCADDRPRDDGDIIGGRGRAGAGSARGRAAVPGRRSEAIAPLVRRSTECKRAAATAAFDTTTANAPACALAASVAVIAGAAAIATIRAIAAPVATRRGNGGRDLCRG